MRCFREAPLRSSPPAHFLLFQTPYPSTPVAAHRSIASGSFHRAHRTATRRSLEVKRSSELASSSLNSSNSHRCGCTTSARWFSEHRATGFAPTYRTQTTEFALHQRKVTNSARPTVSAASHPSNRLPASPRRAARRVTLRNDASAAHNKPSPSASIKASPSADQGGSAINADSDAPPLMSFRSSNRRTGEDEEGRRRSGVNEGAKYSLGASRGGYNSRSSQRVESGPGMPAPTPPNGVPFLYHPGQRQRQEQHQQLSMRQTSSRVPYSVPRVRNVDDVKSLPGGSLAHARGISALMADTNAEERVVAMLKSDQRRANPGCVLSIPETTLINVPSTTLKRCVLPLTIPGVAQPVLAIGQSTKAKLARALCFMHAEQLLDFYASSEAPVTDNTASHPLSSLPGSSTGSVPPPPLEERKVTGATTAPKQRDFENWDDYVNASETYVRDTAARATAEALEQQRVPPSGHPVADRAAELLRRNRRRYAHPQVLQELNESLREGTQLIQVAHLASKVFVATLKLDPKTGLTATGVSKNSKDARRECAAHALCIMQLLQQDAEGRPQDGEPASFAGKTKPIWENGTLKDSKGKSKSVKDATDATQPGAALDAVLQHLQPSHERLLRYFNLLFGSAEMAPTTVFTRETAANGSVLYRCELTMGDITCSGKGVNRFEAERSAMEDGVTELLLYDERLQAIQTFVDANPSITPESIPSAALPSSLVEQLEHQLQPVEHYQQQQQERLRAREAKRGVEGGQVDADGSKSFNREERALLQLSERAFAADPQYAARMQAALHAMRQHPTYLTNFHPRRSTLAMAAVRTQLLDAISHHRVTVVCGTTGCGKTTQVPQYILDHEIEQGRGGSCNILVTQPRRLSSFSVADRIAHERLSTVGKDVGYAVRLDARPGRHITICTTGVLLQIFSTHPELEHVSHLIIDEVHERDINCDVVLALVKELLQRNSRLRVVLMSATMQSDMFATYFGADTPVIQVEGAVYPVTVRYLDDIAAEAAEARFYSPNFDVVPLQSSKDTEKNDTSRQRAATSPRTLLRRPPKTDYNLIAYLVHRAVQVDLHHQTTGKSILVFLPGWKELVSAKAAIEAYHGPLALSTSDVRFHIILLHSTVDSAKQRECFSPAPAGTVKVVLATNIAESGITIDDAAVVIDTGLIKTTTWAGRPSGGGSGAPALSPASAPSALVPLGSALQFTDTTTATAPTPVFSTQLTLGYASQANGTQRKGRAGRTQGGVCYRLYTKGLWDALPAFPEADIHRVPLTQVLLKLLSLGYAHPRETLRTFLEPPSSTNVAVSMRLLSDIGAVDAAEHLTPLGDYLAKLPCDPRIGKMIIMGAVLRCLDSVLTVAACADVSPYVTSRELSGPARKKRYLLARGSQSDHISYLNAFNAFCANGEREEFARFNLLHSGNLRIISKYKAQYRDILLHAGLITEDDTSSAVTDDVFFSRSDLLSGGGAEDGDLDVVTEADEDMPDLLEEEEEAEAAKDDADAVAADVSPPRGNKAVGGAFKVDAGLPKALASPSKNGDDLGDNAALVYTGQLCVDTSALSRHSFDVALVKACVCAALFPNVAVLRPPPATGSFLRQRRRAEKVELRTKHFTSIKPSKESACRRVGGPREHDVPNRTELLDELHSEASGGGALRVAGGAAVASTDTSNPAATLAKPTPALFYVFQDVFGVKEARQEFLTTLSSVSVWALLLFGVPESRAQYNSVLSLCVIDGWIAVHMDAATYRLLTALRHALYTCLHGKYHRPQDAQNNAALRAVTEMCQAVLKAPVLPVHAAVDKTFSDDRAGVVAAVQASRLVDTGSIIDPLAFARRAKLGDGAGGDQGGLADLAVAGDLGSPQDSELDDDDDDEEEENVVF